jgi:molecular chaperone GrpE
VDQPTTEYVDAMPNQPGDQSPPPAESIELPDDPDAAIDLLLAEVTSARTEAAGHLDHLQRVAAEFENYRKRVERDRTETVERSTERVIASLLPVLDSFDQAFTHEPGTEHEAALVKGMQSVYHQLIDVLAAEGLQPIPAVGEAFDPTVHEAVAGGGDGDLRVTTEMRRGYTLRGRVLRPALVAVAGEEDGAA